MVEPYSSNFRVITTNVLGVQIFRKFTVLAGILPKLHVTYLKFGPTIDWFRWWEDICLFLFETIFLLNFLVQSWTRLPTAFLLSAWRIMLD